MGYLPLYIVRFQGLAQGEFGLLQRCSHPVAVQFKIINSDLDMESFCSHICSPSMREAVFASSFSARQDCSVLIIKGCVSLLFMI